MSDQYPTTDAEWKVRLSEQLGKIKATLDALIEKHDLLRADLFGKISLLENKVWFLSRFMWLVLGAGAILAWIGLTGIRMILAGK